MYYSSTGVCVHTHIFKVAISLIDPQFGIISVHKGTEVWYENTSPLSVSKFMYFAIVRCDAGWGSYHKKEG